MSFTRRHYEEVARIIATQHEYVNARPTWDRAQSVGYRAALNTMQGSLCRMFAADNPRFDATRFDMACEPRSGK